MSNSSSFKKVPPVLRDLTTVKVLKQLREPFAIAILASLGVHGLLWFGLPLLPSTANKPATQRTLSVVELSPLEQQARLPQSSALLQPIPPRGDAPLSTPSNAGVPDVPVDPTVTNDSSLYEIPGAASQVEPGTGTSSTTTQRSNPRTTSKTRQNQPPPETETTDSPNDESADDKISNRATDLNAPTGQPPSKGRADLEKQALQQSFAFNAAGTAPHDVSASLGAAASKIAEKFNVQNWEGKPIAIGVPYPKEACQFQHDGKPVQGTTGLAVVMLPDGTLSESALKIKSSGFTGLDQAAIQFVEKQWDDLVKQNKLEPGVKPKAFVLELTVAPTAEDCASGPKPAS